MTETAVDLLITDVCVWTAGEWREHRDVAVAGGRVAAIRPAGAERAAAPHTVDGSGGHLLPGIVNTHTHLNQALLRGIGEGLPLLAWLRGVGEATVALTPEQAYTAAACAAVEALRSGTTTLVEHMWPHTSREVRDAVLRALQDAGIRAVLCVGAADRPDATRAWGIDPRLLRPLEEVFGHVDELAAKAEGGAVTLGLAVPNPRSLTPRGMELVRGFAGERDLPVSIHLLETATDEEKCREHTGMGAVEFLRSSGFLWDRLLAVHCCELDAAGRRALAEAGTAVSYNPLSNMRLGSGVAPVPQMRAAGIDVGIGVDGAASNDTQDALEALRIGAYLQRAARKRADLLGFAEMMGIGSGGANRALGLPEVPGGIAEGGPADLFLVRFERDIGCVPAADPGAVLLTTGSARVVDTVVVGGEVVLSGGRHAFLDESALIERARACAPPVPAGR
ncbi:amidohydrolase family protein [Nocardiopsis composta]|uniref:5-methylthioadenosine/S-adenosylhomocysteine deaminase n=1 Tax=Nocardiopsis composta TaxID=157465 RepID=A0A7W8VGW9_9ACTN|nr:amidohydrolase family protein [Nocardiopsis composta]MBB5435987.1 5-methylthioadenosine/S-adenosylhomocysteine deaminase [Nocardiopsis composta]